MNPAEWIDTATVPPRHLPPTVDAALAYLAEALGHAVYAQWTLARLKRRYGSLAEAKAAQPVVLKLVLAHDSASRILGARALAYRAGRAGALPEDRAGSAAAHPPPLPGRLFARDTSGVSGAGRVGSNRTESVAGDPTPRHLGLARPRRPLRPAPRRHQPSRQRCWPPAMPGSMRPNLTLPTIP